MSDKKTNGSDVKTITKEQDANLKTQDHSQFNKNMRDFLSKPTGKITSLILILLLVGSIALIAYDQIIRNNQSANAGLVCGPRTTLSPDGTRCVRGIYQGWW